MPSAFHVVVLGHITEPETKITPQGHNLVSFSVAVSSKRGGEETTTWARCTAWGKQAEGLDALAQRGLFAKGALVQVTGQLVAREYQANDGSTRTSLDVNANDVRLCSPPRGADSGNATDDARQQFRNAGQESSGNMSTVPF